LAARKNRKQHVYQISGTDGSPPVLEPEIQALTTKICLLLRAARNVRKLYLQTLSGMTGGGLPKPHISNYTQGLRRLGVAEARLFPRRLARCRTSNCCVWRTRK